mmetsp:Transcript_19029/g.44264  ORF Transcript_19029/g.44264 Transcript_19029/m.44264 type:complete len:107 (-) Transcript_19029:139-459(-)
MLERKKFYLTNFFANVISDWLVCKERCAICRNDLNEPSIDFQTNIMQITVRYCFEPCDSKSIGVGTCGHTFHIDCIERWLFDHISCPLCARHWKYFKIALIIIQDV